jgi:flagellar basal body-associated protein FliL
VFPRGMVYLRNINVDTLHKGAKRIITIIIIIIIIIIMVVRIRGLWWLYKRCAQLAF